MKVVNQLQIDKSKSSREINKSFIKNDIIKVKGIKHLFKFIEYRDYGFSCLLENMVTKERVFRFAYANELELKERPFFNKVTIFLNNLI